MALVNASKTLTSKLFSRHALLKPLYIRIESIHPGPNDKLDYPYLWVADQKVPETPKEIEEAAAKYNLHPKEYKPFDKIEGNAGDYPDLPFIGAAAKDPYYPYDFPSIRRNYNEAIHLEVDQIGQDRYDAGVEEMISTWSATKMFCGTLFGYWVLSEIFEYFPWFQCVMEKQYPQPGTVHYTFEPLR